MSLRGVCLTKFDDSADINFISWDGTLLKGRKTRVFVSNNGQAQTIPEFASKYSRGILMIFFFVTVIKIH